MTAGRREAPDQPNEIYTYLIIALGQHAVLLRPHWIYLLGGPAQSPVSLPHFFKLVVVKNIFFVKPEAPTKCGGGRGVPGAGAFRVNPGGNRSQSNLQPSARLENLPMESPSDIQVETDPPIQYSAFII